MSAGFCFSFMAVCLLGFLASSYLSISGYNMASLARLSQVSAEVQLVDARGRGLASYPEQCAECELKASATRAALFTSERDSALRSSEFASRVQWLGTLVSVLFLILGLNAVKARKQSVGGV